MRTPRALWILATCLLIGGVAEVAEAGPPPKRRSRPAYPEIVGEAVGPQNHAYWPVRVQRLDAIRWTFSEGRHVGMAAPLGAGLLFVQAGGGGIRGVEAGTGKRWWLSPGQMNVWNYSTCVLGPGGIAYGGNHGWVQAVDRKGKRLWRTELQCDWIHRPPAISPDGRTIYVGGDALGIAALDAKTGHVNWMRRDFRSPWNTYCFDDSGNLLAGTRAGLFSLAPDGKERWTLAYPRENLMVVDELLFGTGKDGELRAIDLKTRTQRWAWRPGARIVGLAYGDNGRIVASLLSGELACLSRSGHVRWRRKLSPTALHQPVAVKGGETLVADAGGVLSLCDSNGAVISSIETGDQPYRWRPTVSREGLVYLGHRNRIVCITGKRAPKPERVVASELAIVADDFVVDVWVNGKKIPLDARELVAEIHGATTERIHVDLHEGDWVVFNVVANRLRWNGASYFGVHATGPEGEMAFVSKPGGAWSACDDPSQVAAFLADASAGAEQPARAPAHPWSGAAGMWRSLLGGPFHGKPVWGAAPNTWIKVRVGRRARPRRPARADASPSGSRSYWQSRLARIEEGMTPDQVKAVLPSLADGSGDGVILTGGGLVLLYRLCARWLVRVGFTFADGCTGLGDLIDVADPQYDDTLLCHLTEVELRGKDRWRTVGEILVGSGGDYAFTRYPLPAPDSAGPRTFQGQLPAALAKRLHAAFEDDTRHYQVAVEDAKAQHPDGVEALRAYLRRTHPDGR